MAVEFSSSGPVAERAGLPRWRLLYLIERGDLPGPSLKVPGRRLFSPEDERRIHAALEARPELRGTDKSGGISGSDSGA